MDDAIFGLAGDNRMNGGSGADTIDAGGGDDVVTISGTRNGYGFRANGGVGIDTLVLNNSSCLWPSDLVNFENLRIGASGSFQKLSNFSSVVVESGIRAGLSYQRFGTGNASDNIIIGNGQSKVIEGSAGYDTLTGGAGSDLFIIRPNFGVDVIADFEAAGSEDAVLLSSSIFASFSHIMANSAQVGADTWIGDGLGNTVVLLGVQQSAWHANDFGLI